MADNLLNRWYKMGARRTTAGSAEESKPTQPPNTYRKHLPGVALF
jgi:hypothetical protein